MAKAGGFLSKSVCTNMNTTVKSKFHFIFFATSCREFDFIITTSFILFMLKTCRRVVSRLLLTTCRRPSFKQVLSSLKLSKLNTKQKSWRPSFSLLCRPGLPVLYNHNLSEPCLRLLAGFEQHRSASYRNLDVTN